MKVDFKAEISQNAAARAGWKLWDPNQKSRNLESAFVQFTLNTAKQDHSSMEGIRRSSRSRALIMKALRKKDQGVPTSTGPVVGDKRYEKVAVRTFGKRARCPRFRREVNFRSKPIGYSFLRGRTNPIHPPTPLAGDSRHCSSWSKYFSSAPAFEDDINLTLQEFS